MAERVHRRPTRCSRPGLRAYRPVFHTIICPPRVNRWRLVAGAEAEAGAHAQPRLRRARTRVSAPSLPPVFFFSSPLSTCCRKVFKSGQQVSARALCTRARSPVRAPSSSFVLCRSPTLERATGSGGPGRDAIRPREAMRARGTMTATQLILVWIVVYVTPWLFFADRLAIVAPTTSARYAFGYIGRSLRPTSAFSGFFVHLEPLRAAR